MERKKRTKITSEIISRIRKMVNLGIKHKEIAKRLNIGTTTLSFYKRINGIRYIKQTAKDKKDKIIKLYLEGKTVKEICKIIGYRSPTTIKNILNDSNIESNIEKSILLNKEKIKEIAEDCLSYYEVSKKVGCSVTTVKKYMNELNLHLKLKTRLSEKEVKKYTLPSLKYDFNEDIRKIPQKDKREYIENKIRYIILHTRHYVSILTLNNYGIRKYMLGYYKISLLNINREFGLCSGYQSSLEAFFADFCKKYNIKYVYQKSFNTCADIDKLRFDFYLPEMNILIEIQGKQHFMPINKFGGDSAYIDCKKRDRIKKKWCIKNNIKLYTISYKDLYKKNFLEKTLNICPIAMVKSGELLETPEADNQQPS